MDSPFFRNRRFYQQPEPIRHPFSRSPSLSSVPVYHLDPAREILRPSHPIQRLPEKNAGRKVVQIPVHFVGSEKVDRSASALKIQKVFRGFLVRKCLKKIKDIKLQVDEIEERLLNSEVVELVRRDKKERLRMNETLMSLLFKLDSICGVDFGVRGCRKAVIRKAIALQEKIDAIVAIDLEGNGETVDQETENRAFPEINSPSHYCDDPATPKDSLEYREILEDRSCAEGGNQIAEGEGNDGEVDIIDVGVDREVKVSEANSVANCESLDLVEEKPKEGNGANDDNKRNQELLERMMEENEKMMRLMTQLFERNETQTRMLNALTHRVELLEKAFVCDRLRKKKKKKKTKTAVCRED